MVNEEYVIKLIKNKLEMVDAEKKDQIDLLSIANLKDILKRINDDKEYFNYFLLDIKDEDINAILSITKDDEEKNNFAGMLFYIKKIIEISKKEETAIPLSDNQLLVLKEFAELLKRYVNISEYKNETLKGKEAKNKTALLAILEKLEKKAHLNGKDIDNLKLLDVSLTELDQIISFVNEYNVQVYLDSQNGEEKANVTTTATDKEENQEKLEEANTDEVTKEAFLEKPSEEEKIETNVNDADLENKKEVSPSKEENIKKDVPKKKKENNADVSKIVNDPYHAMGDSLQKDDEPKIIFKKSLNQIIEEDLLPKTDKQLDTNDNSGEEIDLFKPQSFDFVPKQSKNKEDDTFKNEEITANEEMAPTDEKVSMEEESPLKENAAPTIVNTGTVADGITEIKNWLKELNINYDELPAGSKSQLLNNSNMEDIKGVISYLKEKRYTKEIMMRPLCLLLSQTNDKSMNASINLLNKYYKLTDENIVSLINRFTVIFTKKGYNNLIKNIDIIKNLDGQLVADVIQKNPGLLATNSDNLKEVLEVLSNFKVSSSIFLHTWIYNLDVNDLLKNVDVLNSYGLDAYTYIDDETFTLLLNPNLPFMLDQFIEMGMDSYIYSDETQAFRKIKSLIIKRIFYAYKNNLSIWKNDNVIDSFEKIIQNNYLIVSEDDITGLIKKYPKLEALEEGYRLALYTNTNMAKIKRKCELVFGNKIISRLKVYSVLNCLLDAGISLKEALIYAITYNSILEPYELEKLETCVNNIMGGE